MAILKVLTDQSDYAPHSKAYFTASGTTDGGTIEFMVQIVSAPGADGIYGTADDIVDDGLTSLLANNLWYVTDGGHGDLDAIAGEIGTRWFVDPDALNQHLLLTARDAGADGVFGTEDDAVATTGFTDAEVKINKVYQHWADGDAATGSAAEWNNNILSANKSDYFEGEVIPHVFVYKASNQAPLVKA